MGMMPPGYTAAPVEITLGPPADLTQANDNAGPGNVEVVWSTPRDFEIDMQAVLLAAFRHYGLNDIRVLINGAFEAAMLRIPDPAAPTDVNRGTVVPVITINLSSDVASRVALGEVTFASRADDAILADGVKGAAGDPPIIDPVLVGSENITLKNQASRVSVDMSVYCLNESLAKGTYLFIKTLMFASEKTFMDLGYIEPPMRTSASRSTSIQDFDGGSKFMYEWQMTYEAMHYDFIAGIDSLASLIAIRSEVPPSLDPDGQATQTAQLTTF